MTRFGVLALGLWMASFGCEPTARPGDPDHDALGGAAGAASDARASVRKVIGARGGVVALEGASLEFPPGALSAETEIRVSVLDPADLANLPTGVSYVSAPVAFEPHGLELDGPVSVTLDYDASFDEDLVVAKLDDEHDESWQAGAVGNHENGRATFALTSFSVWVVAHDPQGILAGGVPIGTGGTSSPGSGGTSSAGTGGLGAAGSSGGLGGTGGLGTGGLGTGGVGTGGLGGTVGETAFLDAGEISGFVRAHATTGVSLTTNLDTITAGDDFCASGTVLQGPAFTNSGGLELTLDEPVVGTVGTFTPVLDGIELDLTWNTGASHRLVIGDGTTSWCAPLPLASPIQFVHWDSFNTDCTLGFSGTAYDKEPIRTLRIDVPSDATANVPFDFCFGGVSDVPTGYYDGGIWAGYAFAASTTGATASHDLASHRTNDNFCTTGNIEEGTFGTSMIAFHLNQPEEGGRLGAATGVAPLANYLVLDVTNTGTAPAEVVLFDGTTEWCSPVPAAPPPIALAWADFTDCLGAPSEYDGEPLIWIGVRAKGQELVPVSFNLCVDSLSDTNSP